MSAYADGQAFEPALQRIILPDESNAFVRANAL
jgi:hypothetical protein